MERRHYATGRARYDLRCIRIIARVCESLSGLIARVFAPRVIYAKRAGDDRDPPPNREIMVQEAARLPRSSPAKFANRLPHHRAVYIAINHMTRQLLGI